MRFALVLATGCMMHHSSATPDPGDKSVATACDASMQLVGANATTSSPVSLAPDSIGWCLHVDASSMQHAAPVLFVQSAADTGVDSNIELTVDDTTGGFLQSGFDVTSGQSSPTTFARLDWQMTTGEVVDVILRARAFPPRDTTLTATLTPGLD